MYTKNEILKEVTNIFRDVLENDKIVLNENSTGDEIEEWDSLAHIQLVVAIEKHFKIRFTSLEIINFKNIGEMCEGISAKTSAMNLKLK
jgi:acyl carrier protein